MKKVLVLMAIMALLWANAGAAENIEDTGDVFYDTPIDQTYDIVPDIQIFEPGTIRVQISWVDPLLTFVQRERSNDHAMYYALKNESNVLFNVVNNSRPSSLANGFNGSITVKAETIDSVDPKGDNIKVLLDRGGEIIPIANGGTFSLFKLSYTNREDVYINQYPLSSIITADKTADQIEEIMTVKIRFIIAAAL